jgi:hypothetical protein
MLTKVKKVIKPPIEALMASIENTLIRRQAKIQIAPIFIIGPPRTGSTLLYHLMARRFNACYFSNLMIKLPMAPVCIAKIVAPINGCDPPNSFKSNYGYTFGWRAPNQGQQFWDLWFPEHPHHIESRSLSPLIKHRIRNTVALMQSTYQAPFINKWPRHAVRLLPLSAIFPEALFIRIKRKPEFVAYSILESRKQFCKDEAAWFSVKPKNFKKFIAKKPVEQVCEQVYYIEETIDNHSEIIGKDRFYCVNYEELTEKPQQVMQNISIFYRKTSISNSLDLCSTVIGIFLLLKPCKSLKLLPADGAQCQNS